MQRLSFFLAPFLLLLGGCAMSTVPPPDESMNNVEVVFACYAVEADYRRGGVQTNLRIRFWDDVGYNVVLELAHPADELVDGASFTQEVVYSHDDGYGYRGEALFDLTAVNMTGLESVQTPPPSPTAGFESVTGTIEGRVAIDGLFERPAGPGEAGTPVVDVVLYTSFVLERCADFDSAWLP